MVVVDQASEPRASRHRNPGSWFTAIPLLAFVVGAYVAFAASGADFTLPRFEPSLPSGATWTISLGDMLVATALFLLFFEVLKSTRTSGKSVIDHSLSLIVFIVCLILFLVWPPSATSIFFVIMLVTLVDVIAGFSVTIRAARRDYTVAGPD